MPEINFKPSYRPDIDGLRAVAILPVVFYHALPFLVPGGFVGVDVFFVISGYLISLILFRSMEHNDFSFIEFYVHRILRIFPALLLVLIACFVVGWFTLLPDAYSLLGKHIAAGASFLENFTLWVESGYFDVATAKKPLMHLWSLAVEEQYYLLFPLLVWLSWRSSLRLIWLVTIICLLSLGANIIEVYLFDPKFAYLSPFTRFWELMVGALLAFQHSTSEHGNKHYIKLAIKFTSKASDALFKRKQSKDHGTERIEPLFASILSIIGASLIIISIFTLNKTVPFPGVFALLPVLGAAFLISAGQDAWFNRLFLSNRQAVYIGKISYPWYLWHWPLLSFPLVMTGVRPNNGVVLGLVFSSFLLAAITYKFVEKPIRYGKSYRPIKTISLVFLMFIVGFSGYNVYSRHGLEFRTKMILKNNSNLHFREIPPSFFYLNNCLTRFPHFQGACTLSKNDAPTVAVIGDSHSGDVFYGLTMLTKHDKAINVINLRKNSSVFLKGVGTFGGHDTPYRAHQNIQETATITEEAMHIVARSKSIRTVIVDLHGFGYFHPPYDKKIRLLNHPGLTNNYEIWKAGLNKTISYLLSHDKKVIVILDWPRLPFNPQKCLSYRTSNNSSKTQNCGFPRKLEESNSTFFHRLAHQVLNKYPSVYVFDSPKYFCDRKLCYAKKNGVILYGDHEHLSLKGSIYFAKYLLPVINKVMR